MTVEETHAFLAEKYKMEGEKESIPMAHIYDHRCRMLLVKYLAQWGKKYDPVLARVHKDHKKEIYPEYEILDEARRTLAHKNLQVTTANSHSREAATDGRSQLGDRRDGSVGGGLT